MNKTYKSVWNESTGTWVAVSELKKGRSKSKRAKTAISKAILAQVAVGGLSLAGASAYAAVTEGAATGTNATAIGKDSLAEVTDGVAIGTGASANLDSGANASKTGAVAIGSNAEAFGSGAAFGTGASAGSDSLAIGANSSATLQSIAIGSNARSFNTSAIALGDSASAGAAKSLAIGANSNASAAGAVALGSDSVANRANTISVGNALIKRQITNVANATQDNDAVNLSQLKSLGLKTDTSGNAANSFVAYDDATKAAVSLGGSSGTQIHNVAAGTSDLDAVNKKQLADTDSKIRSDFSSIATSTKYIGFGPSTAAQAQASGQDAVSIGGNAFANGSRTLALGANAVASATNSIAIGYGSQASEANTVSVGTSTAGRRIVNVAEGTKTTDAVNLGQVQDMFAGLKAQPQSAPIQSRSLTTLSAVQTRDALQPALTPDQLIKAGPTDKINQISALGSDSISIGLNTRADGPGSTAIGSNVNSVGENSVSVGNLSVANGSGSQSFGYRATSLSDHGLALGNTATVLTDSPDALAIGSSANAGADSATAIGKNALSAGVGTYVLGNDSTAFAASSIVLGDNSMVGKNGSTTTKNSVAIGTKNTVSGSSTFVLGNTVTAAGSNSVVLGEKSDGSQSNVISVGAKGSERKIVNVATGTADTDAVNVKQLKDSIGSGGNADGVNYDTPAHDKITLGGTSSTTPVTISNVAAGKAPADAVNVKQLADAGLTTDSSGNVTNAFVAYDDTTKGKVTFGGKGSTTPVVLANVAAGKAETDAVNVKQLTALGATVDSLGNATNSFVAYDDSTKGKVTLGGTNSTTPVTLANVAAGKAGTDAVNVNQLTALGGKVDSNGNALNSFVAYDDTTKGKVTFGGKGSTTPVVLANVAAGKAGTDAVNVNQLNAIGVKTDTSGNPTNAFVAYDSLTAKDTVTLEGKSGTKITNLTAGAINSTSKDAINGSQLYNTASTTAAALGGGAALNPDGTIKAPTYTVAGKDYTDVGQALGAVAQNGATDAVKYDTSAHDKVTLGGTSSTTPVTVTNVAAGKAASDAVNVKQLADAGLKTDSSGNVTNAFVAYDNATKAAVTLGGSNGTQIHNVAAGTATKDAVNVGQLQSLGATVDSSGNVTNSFVAYDDTTKGKVTFGGKGSTTPVVLANVAAGKAGTDAVNVNQLNAFGVKTDPSGNVTNAFVAYDSLATKDTVTLEGKSGTKITNLTAGAVNSTSKDAINGSQLFNLGSTTAAALSGGAALNPDGTIKAPTYNVAGTDYADVGKALDAVAKNGAGADAVKYDTPSHDKITLGGTAASAPVKLANVADGVDAHDAATIGQLNNLASDFKSVNTSLKYVRFGASVAATAQASGTDSVAIGGNAFANAAGALAIGRDAVASGKNSIAIGIGSQASQPNVVSFGSATVQRRLTQVANAQDDFDAVNLGQVTQLIADSKAKNTRSLTMLNQNVSTLAATTITPADMIKAGPTDKQGQIEALGTDSVAIGLNTHANGDQSVAIGTNTSAGREGSVAIGNSAVSSGAGSTAIGVNAEATNGARALAIGNYAQSGSTDSIVIGNNSVIGDTANETTDNAIAVGSKNKVTGANSVVLGNSVSVTGKGSFVLGSNTKVAGDNSVILGAGSDGSQSNVISVGAKGSERKIVNVASGTADTDAVNVKQLNDKVAGLGTGGGTSLVTQAAADQDVLVAASTGGTHVNFAGTSNAPRELIGVAAGTGDTSAATVGQLKPVVAALGGGAAVGADGKVTGPTYHVQNGNQTNVGDALGALDTGLNDVKTQLGQAGTGLVAQQSPTSAITVGALTGGTELNIANKDGVARKITNVAAGDVSLASKDAINGSQLYSVGSGLATAIGGGATLGKDGSITQPTFNLGGLTTHNVGDALLGIDGRVTTNTKDIADIKGTLSTIGSGGGSAADAVKYDSSSHDKVTLGNAGKVTSLTNLSDAKLTGDSTDAVTGKQLYATNAKVDELGNAIKNVSTTGSSVIAAGPVDTGTTGPAPTATGTGSLAVGNGSNAGKDGATAVGSNASAGGKDSLALGNGAQAPADNAVALGAHSVADQPNTVSVGSEGSERRVTNVAPGINGTDAVNMNQLGAVQSGLNDVARKSYGGIAAATALTMIPDVDANKTLSIGVGGGTYRGYAATAIGGTARITQNIKVRVGAGWSSSGTTVGAGASYQW